MVGASAHDLALLIVDGEDKKPAEYLANQSDIARIQATRGPTFARLEYANTSGHVAVVRVESTSGLSTALALPRRPDQTPTRLASSCPMEPPTCRSRHSR